MEKIEDGVFWLFLVKDQGSIEFIYFTSQPQNVSNKAIGLIISFKMTYE